MFDMFVEFLVYVTLQMIQEIEDVYKSYTKPKDCCMLSKQCYIKFG